MDFELLKIALEQNELAFESFPDVFKNDISYLKKFLHIRPLVFKRFTFDQQLNEELIFELCCIDINLMELLKFKTRDNKDIMSRLIELNY